MYQNKQNSHLEVELEIVIERNNTKNGMNKRINQEKNLRKWHNVKDAENSILIIWNSRGITSVL